MLFTSCDDDYYYDSDSYLVGAWELIYADGRYVSGTATNYLQFYNNGTGWYYYYERGVPYKMALNWSVDVWSNSSVLYIAYADGSRVSMNYWYNSNATRLNCAWQSGSIMHQYVYQLVDSFNWDGTPYYAPAKADNASEELPAILQPGK